MCVVTPSTPHRGCPHGLAHVSPPLLFRAHSLRVARVQEDRRLLDVVAAAGSRAELLTADDWNTLATNNLPGKTGKQCRERYTTLNQLGASRDEWTEDEEAFLFQLQVSRRGFRSARCAPTAFPTGVMTAAG
ncbi:hypothetical protein EON68_03185 [archaeon]|nr:MAG: hypothetical protein EON68_03185 [archaeon]